MKVDLTYFKTSGKYYSDGSYESSHDSLWEIWAEVKVMATSHTLPGLIEGHSDYIVLVDVSDHEHNHPWLFVPEAR